MPAPTEMIGLRFGKLVVRSEIPRESRPIAGRRYFRCDCDCGGSHVVSGDALRSGLSLHCKACNRTGQGTRNRPRKLSPGKFAEMVAGIERGESDHAVARRAGIHQTAVRLWRIRFESEGFPGHHVANAKPGIRRTIVDPPEPEVNPQPPPRPVGEIRRAGGPGVAETIEAKGAPVGARIRAARVSLGLDRRELAGRLGITYQRVADIEADRKPTSLERVIEIAAALGIDPHSLDPRLASTDPAAARYNGE
jgi:DNA-binding XRE family transcriptional regulator